MLPLKTNAIGENCEPNNKVTTSADGKDTNI